MKVEIHVNGTLNLVLKPETHIESVVVQEMMEGAAKGKAVRITESTEAMVVSVEK